MATNAAGFSTSGYKPIGAPKPTPSHHTSLFGEATNFVTGFIGHLGSDVVNSVVGIPMGVTMLFKHPITSVEQMGKATWHDWSPLIKAGEELATGNPSAAWSDSRVWAHNFYEHPLAPILDIASVLTGGGAIAARVGDSAAELGIVSKAGRVAAWSNPGKVAMAEHMASTNGDVEAAQALLAVDKRVGGVVKRPSGMMVNTSTYSKNPIIRIRQKTLASAGEKAAATQVGKKIGVDKFLGAQGTAARWQTMDRAIKNVSATNLVQHELGTIENLGKTSVEMSGRDKLGHILPGIENGMKIHAIRIKLKDLNVGELHKEGYTFFTDPAKRVSADVEKMMSLADAGQFEDALKQVGGVYTSPRLKNAMHEGDSVLVVRGHKAGEHPVVAEAINSHKFVEMFYNKPTRIWKYLILGAAPRFVVNNFVGNSLMLGMSANPVIMTEAMLHHFVTRYGLRKGRKMWEEGMSAADVAKSRATTAVAGKDWKDKYYAFEHKGWGMSEEVAAKTGPTTVTERAMRRVGAGWMYEHNNLYGFTQRISDEPQRNIAMDIAITRTPEYQAIYAKMRKKEASGFSGHLKAHNKAADVASQSIRVRSYVREQVNHTLGQYHHFTKFEQAIKTVVPFYSWDRAITRHTAEMVKNRPYQAAMLSAISNRGVEDTKQILGQLPDFLQGVIPASAISAGAGPLGILGMLTGPSKNGRKAIFETQGINPYSTIGDIVNTGEGLVGIGRDRVGSSLGGQLNPLLQGAVESLSGTSLLSGAPIKSGPLGLFGSVFLGPVENAPEITVAKMLLEKYGLLFGGYPTPKKTPSGKPGKPFLFQKDTRATATSWLGIPTRQVDLGTAEAMYNTQQGLKKKPAGAKLLPISGGFSGGSLGKTLPGL